ncbi:Uncharacterised protein [Mycobacteroides abscessus subsp. bolletii]|nr:Uncharacterised protein [Mycobacteroides abscessus subsp. bolletii]SKX25595.1 Uncharacterised protein [Mycobacteroides abscessus subsp. bolletii]
MELRLWPFYGLGKHGDKAETRSNKRSPWDTLHPARESAGVSVLTDQKPCSLIVSEITKHFKRCPPIKTKDEV